MKIHINLEPMDETIDIDNIDITDASKIDEIVKEYIRTHCDYGWKVIEITAEEQEEWIQDLLRAHEG